MIKRIKNYLKKSKFSKVYVERFSNDDWNGVTAAALSQSQFKKSYQLIEGFINRHKISPELVFIIEDSGLNYMDVLDLQVYPTDEQLNLIHNCMIRSIPDCEVIKLIKSKV